VAADPDADPPPPTPAAVPGEEEIRVQGGTGECGGVRRGYVRPNILDVQENVIRVFSLSPVKRYSLQIPLILQCTFM
jgi:hypothetical protein